MTEQETPERLLTVQEAAEILSLSVVQVRRYIADGSLPVIRFGRRAIRIKPSDLERFIEARREGATGDHL
jgi:excisionase family DNA binding protein